MSFHRVPSSARQAVVVMDLSGLVKHPPNSSQALSMEMHKQQTPGLQGRSGEGFHSSAICHGTHQAQRRVTLGRQKSQGCIYLEWNKDYGGGPSWRQEGWKPRQIIHALVEHAPALPSIPVKMGKACLAVDKPTPWADLMSG